MTIKLSAKRCGAKKRNGEPCKAWGMPNGRCPLHGGKSLGGAASGTFKTGRFSKYMPAHLAEKFREAASNPNLRSMDDDLALLETRLCDSVEKLGQPGGEEQWSDAVAAFRELKASNAANDLDGIESALTSLEEILEKGAASMGIWKEIRDTIQDRRRILDSMVKQEYTAKATMPLSEAMTLFAAMVGIIKERVLDRESLNAILGDINRLSARAYGATLAASSGTSGKPN